MKLSSPGSAPASSQAANRILYYDALEAFAIFLVVAVHSVWLKGNVPASISMSFSPVAVPLFFMVHGALLLSKPYNDAKHLKRALRVALQLFIWCTIYLVISLLMGWNKQPFTLKTVYQYYFEAQVVNGTLGLGGSLWFIFALLFVYILHPILITLRDANKLRYLALLLLIFSFGRQEVTSWGAYFAERFSVQSVTPARLLTLLNPLGQYGNCVFYYVFGFLVSDALRTHEQAIRRKKTPFIVVSLLAIILGVALLMLERKIEFGTFAYNWKPLTNQYYRLGGVIQALGFFCLFSQLSIPAPLQGPIVALSVHTIDVYYIHPILVRLMYDSFFKQAYAGVAQNYLRAAIALVLSYFLGQLIRRIPVVKKIL